MVNVTGVVAATEGQSVNGSRVELTAGHITVIIIMGIQPLGRSGQRPELIQATGMALVRCILGKFLGVVCHCFPPYNSTNIEIRP